MHNKLLLLIPIPILIGVVTAVLLFNQVQAPAIRTVASLTNCISLYSDTGRLVQQCDGVKPGSLYTIQIDVAAVPAHKLIQEPPGFKPCTIPVSSYDVHTTVIDTWDCVQPDGSNLGVYVGYISYNPDYKFPIPTTPTPTPTP
jgi:hypothetical protein